MNKMEEINKLNRENKSYLEQIMSLKKENNLLKNNLNNNNRNNEFEILNKKIENLTKINNELKTKILLVFVGIKSKMHSLFREMELLIDIVLIILIKQ